MESTAQRLPAGASVLPRDGGTNPTRASRTGLRPSPEHPPAGGIAHFGKSKPKKVIESMGRLYAPRRCDGKAATRDPQIQINRSRLTRLLAADGASEFPSKPGRRS
jgi:hypothetical protein